MYRVNLEKLAECSKLVSMSSFGGVVPHGTKAYTDWLKAKLNEIANFREDGAGQKIKSLLNAPTWEDKLDRDLEAAWNVSLLMRTGELHFAQQVAEVVVAQLKAERRPIYPVINSDWKSDAWLTGLVLGTERMPDLNPEGIGFGVRAKLIPEQEHKKGLPPGQYDVLYVDDASYSGTQIFNLANSIFLSGLRPTRILLMLAGISTQAMGKISSSRLFSVGKCKPFCDEKVTTQITNIWEPSPETRSLLWAFFGDMKHIEADPLTLEPKPTTGEMPIFLHNCLTILPYKIPDSLSVPTHLYLAYDPITQSSVFESEGGHIFRSNGQVNYRTIMAGGAAAYATIMTM
ncbi:hypothetical protein WJ542_28480 [Paraburkholderia sp. B3]|uniref:hypothetical protein n=1 Tax=Paraburkholderia sp. B3 TaxID=3134791 RepID=UPI00398245E9